MPSPVQIASIVSMPFDENTYIIWSDEGAPECVVIDPGFDTDATANEIEDLGFYAVAILCTHGHSDHIAGNADLKDRWPDCPLVIGAGDAYKLTDPRGNLSAQYGFNLVSPPADRTVHEGEVIQAAGISLAVRETPGHSAGHVVFVIEGEGPTIVLGGDVLFRGGIGRTDFEDGNHDVLLASIRDKLYTLPDDTIVLPGHGPRTTIGHEKRTNPWTRRPGGW